MSNENKPLMHIFDITAQDDIRAHRVYCGKTLREVNFQRVTLDRVEFMLETKEYVAFFNIIGGVPVCKDCTAAPQFQLKVLRDHFK